MKKYVFGYKNEKKFKKLESALKKYNMLAFKKLYFEYYPKIKAGEFLGKVVAEEENIMEFVLDLPTDAFFAKTYGEIELHYEVNEETNSITLVTLSPEEIILSEGCQSELVTKEGLCTMKKYVFGYKNEKKFKKLESALKKYNMLAFKKLYFEYYPKIKAGEFLGKVVAEEENIMEFVLDLPTDAFFAKTYGEIELHYEVNEETNSITLVTLSPEEIILSEGCQSELVTYKGVMLSKEHSDKDKFKINLLNMINKV